MNRKYIVYLTTNLEDSRTYTGIHLNKKENPYELDGYYGSNKELKVDIRRLGKENFTRETLFVYDTKEEAKAKERELVPPEVVKLDTNYNRIQGGGAWPVMCGEEHPLFGTHRSEDEKEKISENHADFSGENNPNYGKGWKIAGEKHPMWGKHLPKETTQKISESLSGENHPNWGKQRSEETKKKIREGNLLPVNIVKQRLKDIEEIPKKYGWKTKITKKWGFSGTDLAPFLKEYAPKYLWVEVKKQRLQDIKMLAGKEDIIQILVVKWGISKAGVLAFMNRCCNVGDINET